MKKQRLRRELREAQGGGSSGWSAALAPLDLRAPLQLGTMVAEQEPFWKTFLSGGVAGIAEIAVMYPLDVAKTRMQLSAGKNVGIVKTLGEVVSTSGWAGLYRGVVTPVLGEAPKRATKFAANNAFKNAIASASPEGKLTKGGAAAAGTLAGVTEALINCPFEVVKVRGSAGQQAEPVKTLT